PAADDHLVFTAQPSDAVAGATISPAVKVRTEERRGGQNHSTATVAVAISGLTTPTLYGTTSLAAVNGTATFSNLSVHVAGTYTLAASSGTLAGDTGASFTISPAADDHLVFTAQPSDAVAGATISPAVKV